MILFCFILSGIAFIVATVSFINTLKRNNYRYIVHKDFFKMED